MDHDLLLEEIKLVKARGLMSQAEAAKILVKYRPQPLYMYESGGRRPSHG